MTEHCVRKSSLKLNHADKNRKQDRRHDTEAKAPLASSAAPVALRQSRILRRIRNHNPHQALFTHSTEADLAAAAEKKQRSKATKECAAWLGDDVVDVDTIRQVGGGE